MKTIEDYKISADLAEKCILKLMNSSGFLKGNYVAKQNEISILNQDDAEIFATDQDVDILKGLDYQYWTSIIEDADSDFGNRTEIIMSMSKEEENIF